MATMARSISTYSNDLAFNTRRDLLTPMFVEMLRNHTERAIILSMFNMESLEVIVLVFNYNLYT